MWNSVKLDEGEIVAVVPNSAVDDTGKCVAMSLNVFLKLERVINKNDW